MSYEIVRYRPDLEEEVARLFAPTFEADGTAPGSAPVETAAAYLRWKYGHNPYIDRPLIYLALAGGRAVGMRGAYGTRWLLAGESHVLPAFGNTLIAPEHRNRGVFPLLMRFALRDLAEHGHDYAINQSATPVTLLASLATGWRAVGRPVILRRRSRAEVASRRRRSGRPLRLVRRAERRLHPLRSAFATLDRRGGATPTADGLAALLETAPDGRLRHVRDAEFLAWRLADPQADHRVAALPSDSGVAACILLRSMRPFRSATVVDWTARRPADLAELIRRTQRRGRLPDLSVWAGTIDDETRAVLAAVGFVETDPGTAAALIVRPTDERPAARGWRLGTVDLLDPGSWELRLLHSERELV